MEKELFDWDGWDGDMHCMTFYNVVLKQQIGEYPPGTKFNGANVMYDQVPGILQFYKEGEPTTTEGGHKFTPTEVVAEYHLHLQVGKEKNVH